jgi:integrase
MGLERLSASTRPAQGRAVILPIMRRPEPDLEVIRSLLGEAAWRRQGIGGVEARRLIAACALAWLAGATQHQLGRLRVCDWLPDEQESVRLRLTDSPDVGVDAKVRVVPVLPALMRAVKARLADIPEAGHESFILGGRSGASARGFAEQSGSAITLASEEKVKSLADLAVRFRDYVQWGAGDDLLREWLANPARTFMTPDHRALPLDDLRRVMRTWHPGA